MTRARWDGFRYAYEGLLYTFSSERHMKFHVFAALITLGCALLLQRSAFECLILLLAITLVMASECMNTAIEKGVDLAMPRSHSFAKIAKDSAAASVLLTAVFAVAVGMYVFVEPIGLLLLEGQWPDQAAFQVMTAVVTFYAVFVFLIALEARMINLSISKFRPNLSLGLLSSALCLLSYGVMRWDYIILMLLLYVIVCGVTLKQGDTIYAVLIGSVAGAGMTVLCIGIHTLGG